MSAREPVIKFSPFEALFIGEKNKVLKRQPMKNTIFVTRLNQQRKKINLRDLFDLEKSSKPENNDVIFKIPQRVCEFLKHRKIQSKRNNHKKQKEEILCYEFEGCKIMTKNHENVVANGKNLSIRTNKVKFKQKFKYKDNIKHKVVKKFPNPTRRRNHFESKYKSLKVKTKNKYNGNRHLLRGKDGKFICKKDYEKLKSRRVSPKQIYMSKYLRQIYLKKKNKQHFNPSQLNSCKDSPELEMPYSIKTVIGLPKVKCDMTAPEAMLNEMSKRYYKTNCHEDFHFPFYPKNLESEDFESDTNLIDIVYEKFPKIIKFESQSLDDFSCALLDSQILKPTQNIKIYEKKKNGFIKDEEIRKIIEKRFPIVKLKRINEIMPNQYAIRNERSVYVPKIDEPYTKKSHLIRGKSFGSFFFRSAEGKDIFIGNLIKPFWQNSWFGSLPES